jgi:hypothetical protein
VICIILAFFLSRCTQLVYSCSDDEEPPKDTSAVPSTSPVIADEPSAQEAVPRVTRSAVKKVPVTRSLKRSKKSQETDVAGEAHGSPASSDDVSKYP